MSVAAEQFADLAGRIESGDRRAESELVARYERGVRLILLKRTQNPQVAKDLCQDTFVIVLRKLRAGDLRNCKRLTAFVSRIAVNLSIEYFRKERRFTYQSSEINSLKLSHQDGKSREIDQETVRTAIAGTLEKLAVPRDREILRRFYLADEDKERICRDLKLTSAHFDRVLHRARRRMRRLINEHPRLKELLIGGLWDG